MALRHRESRLFSNSPLPTFVRSQLPPDETFDIEDFEAGRVYELGSTTVTEDDIVAFAGLDEAARVSVEPRRRRFAGAADILPDATGGANAPGWRLTP